MTQRHYYRARLVGGGPYIPVVVWHGLPLIDGEEVDRSPRWQCLVGTETTARAVLMGEAVPIEVDGILLRSIEGIDQAEYEFQIAHLGWVNTSAPHHPKATPRRAVNFNTVKPPL